ncbi:extracellular dermal glycoprotein [Medicago truncatula]|uniref:Extracellular dermal glycoprotein n=1 Tax=Medicago truncatula TaxID=3880 RepID=A0A072VF41_MEDTR|nr:extracellular dermal glycoprotein [Medicago truncatula]
MRESNQANATKIFVCKTIFHSFSGNNKSLLAATCLGFVDGGKEPRRSIVIGGHQLEENLLEFDLVSSKLGFISSLPLHNSRYSNFRS